jgi:hypothetical protein
MGMTFDEFEVGRYYWKGTEEGVRHYTTSLVLGKDESILRFADILYGGGSKVSYHISRVDREFFDMFIYKHMIPINEAPNKVRHLTIKSIFGKGVIK